MAPLGKNTITDLKKLIYYDFVKMKMLLGKRDTQKYVDVIDILKIAKYEPSMKTFFGEPEGKDLLIDYAIALGSQPKASALEYKQAIKELREIIEMRPLGSKLASRAKAEITRISTKLIQSHE